MKILLDLQCVQVRDGPDALVQKSLAHSKAIVQNRGPHDIVIAVSDLMPSGIEWIRNEFDGLLSQSDIRVWHAKGPVRSIDRENSIRRQQAEILREAFLASLHPDVVHIDCMFSGYTDESVVSIGEFDRSFPVAVTLSETPAAIQLAVPVDGEGTFSNHYWQKLENFLRADLYLTHTETCRTELLESLRLGDGDVLNVSTAATMPMRNDCMDASRRSSILNRFGIDKQFVAIASAPQDVDALIIKLHAYSLLPQDLRERHQLLIVNLTEQRDLGVVRKAITALALSELEVRIAFSPSILELSCIVSECIFFIPTKSCGHFALEAMAGGSAVLADRNFLFTELIGREDSLFDPMDELGIVRKMEYVLREVGVQKALRDHSNRRSQKFSLDRAAQLTLAAFEKLDARRRNGCATASVTVGRKRPTMAFLSPVPPEKTGIADYSAELLPELAKFYKIDIVAPQAEISDPWIRANCPIRTVEWFRAHALNYDRIVYQVGNSRFHSHMFDLMKQYPGVVVLHDFFLGGAYWHTEACKAQPSAWIRELLYAHGYSAIKERFDQVGENNVAWKYPCNLSVIQGAMNVVVHSQGSTALARNWYCDRYGGDWHIVPLLRQPPKVRLLPEARAAALAALDIPGDAFLVCSFGSLGPTKVNHHTIAAWCKSSLSTNPSCYLVFVGINHASKYGKDVLDSISRSPQPANIRITGWASESLFKQYLQATDLCVQLRTLSRGETSAAVLDCMNHGKATIVNSHGTMTELSRNAVWIIPDRFTDEELASALDMLYCNAALRDELGRNAQAAIKENHLPKNCAGQFYNAVERTYATSQANPSVMIKALSDVAAGPIDEAGWVDIARLVARNTSSGYPFRRVFVDVTATASNDLKTGIERAARALTTQWLALEHPGLRFEPVYLSKDGGRWHYRLARKFALGLINCPRGVIGDEPAAFSAGDVVVIADYSGGALIAAGCQGLFAEMKKYGVEFHAVVFDIMPILYPELFPPGADLSFAQWLSALLSFVAGIVAISRAVADHLASYARHNIPPRIGELRIGWFHLGSDISASGPTVGMSEGAKGTLELIRQRPTFLMVGTIEPRKGHLQAIAAFDLLWANDVDVNLVVVGREGWTGLPDKDRRTIPVILAALRSHPRLGSRLFWLDQASDEYLEQVYASSACLLAASVDEGFGLPIIEAMRHEIPVLARDIPVFREVGGDFASYFHGSKPGDLSEVVRDWLTTHHHAGARQANARELLTWKQSAQRFLDIVFNEEWTHRVPHLAPVGVNKSHGHRSAELAWLGFCNAEAEIRWTDSGHACIGFNWCDKYPRSVILTINLDTAGPQEFRLALNDSLIHAGRLQGQGVVLQCAIGPMVSGMNYLSLRLPGARPPHSTDHRLLALGIRQVRFDYHSAGGYL